MNIEPVRNGLRGRRVLLVHEGVFFGGYLADVLSAQGATIIGPVASARQGIALLEQVPQPCALVFSDAVRDDDAIVPFAALKGVATLIVQSTRTRSPWSVQDQAVLTVPFAGFQVVDALCRLLAPALLAVQPRKHGH